MSEDSQPGSPSKSFDSQIERICVRFEEAWKAGQRPSLELHLGEVFDGGRPALLAELVKLDVYYRRRSGEQPTLNDYQAHFPGDSEYLQSLLLSASSARMMGTPMTLRNRPPLECQRLGDFEIVREIGRGGMGIVYEARQVSLNRRVALNVLAIGVGLTDKAVQRFHREAESAAKLHHTNIVPVYTTGEENSLHFYAMELVEGLSLDQVINRLRQATPGAQPRAQGEANSGAALLSTTGPYVESSGGSSNSGLGGSSLNSGTSYFDAVARMMAEVADGLNYAHQLGVIHRDIKPSNLLLSSAGRLSINDFGLARLLEQPGMTVTGEMLGTPRYMSPEQITAGRVPIDNRTDVYSLGATLYEILTLRPPFVAQHRDQLLAQVIQKDPQPPRRVNPKVPIDLETICLKAMDKDPDRRYQTAGQLADDLRRYVNRYAIRARRAGPITRCQKWVRRNPMLAATLAAGLTCAGFAGWLAFQSHLSAAAHKVELLAERRGSALEKAMLLSRMEDFDGARAAIREAEQLGCSAGQIRMLNGQLELSQGHLKEAIEHLEQAVALLPDSVAAWAMLSIAYGQAARPTEEDRALREATSRPAVTPEDYLFRGYAEAGADPEHALVALDEAMRRRPSPLGHMIRMDVLRLQAMDVPDQEKAKIVMADARALKRHFPENALVLIVSITVHRACYHVFGELGQTADQQAALEEGLKDARALEQFADSPRAIGVWWEFIKDIGQGDADRLARLRRAADRPTPDYGYAAGLLAIELYERGEFENAVKILERGKGETLMDIIRVIALAETPNGFVRATDLIREVAARDQGGWDSFNSQLVLRFLGRKHEAVEVSRKIFARPDRYPPVRPGPFQRSLEYCAGRLSAESLISSMQGKRGDLCNAHFCIAVTALADGDRSTARQHLKFCEGTRYFENLPYNLSQMLLSRMDKDPTWPPWIK